MINDDSNDGSNSSDGASGNDNWSDDLDRIPDLASVSEVADNLAASEKKAFEDKPRGEPADDPLVIRIRLIVGAIGFLMFCAAAALSNGGHSARKDDSGGEPLVTDSSGLSLVQDLVCGLGIELLASVLMVVFYHWLQKNGDSPFELPKWIPVNFHWLVWPVARPFRLVLSASVLFCTFPLLMKDNFYSSAFESFGIEIFGAIIIATLLEDVTNLVSQTEP